MNNLNNQIGYARGLNMKIDFEELWDSPENREFLELIIKLIGNNPELLKEKENANPKGLL